MNDVLNEEEVAALLDCEPRTIQEKARAGELPAIKFGRSWRFPRAALLEALDAMARSNRAPAKLRPPPAAVTVTPSQKARRTLPKLIEVRT